VELSLSAPFIGACGISQIKSTDLVSSKLGIIKQEALLLQRDRVRHLSVEILQLQNISLENPIMCHYLCDSTFSRFDTIPECDGHTHRQTDTRRQHIPHLA